MGRGLDDSSALHLLCTLFLLLLHQLHLRSSGIRARGWGACPKVLIIEIYCASLLPEGSRPKKIERRLNSTTLLHFGFGEAKSLKIFWDLQNITEMCCQHFPENQPPQKCFVLKQRGGQLGVLIAELLSRDIADIQLYSNLMLVYILGEKRNIWTLTYHSQFSCLSFYLGIASLGSSDANLFANSIVVQFTAAGGEEASWKTQVNSDYAAFFQKSYNEEAYGSH